MKQSDLKKKRKAMGLTQAQAAKLLNIALRTYTYWERGAYKMKPYALAYAWKVLSR